MNKQLANKGEMRQLLEELQDSRQRITEVEETLKTEVNKLG